MTYKMYKILITPSWRLEEPGYTGEKPFKYIGPTYIFSSVPFPKPEQLQLIDWRNDKEFRLYLEPGMVPRMAEFEYISGIGDLDEFVANLIIKMEEEGEEKRHRISKYPLALTELLFKSGIAEGVIEHIKNYGQTPPEGDIFKREHLFYMKDYKLEEYLQKYYIDAGADIINKFSIVKVYVIQAIALINRINAADLDEVAKIQRIHKDVETLRKTTEKTLGLT